MRRLVPFFFTLCVLGRSQPAQQPAQPPIVVHVQMPPANLWTHIVEPIVQGSIGLFSALIAVSLTQRHQRQLEFHKAELAAKFKSQDNRWTFQKDVYVNLINATDDLLTGFDTLLRRNTFNDERAYSDEIIPPFKAFLKHATLAPLATADPVPGLISAAVDEIMRIDDNDQTNSAQVRILSEHLRLLRGRLQEAGRKDLWDSERDRLNAR